VPGKDEAASLRGEVTDESGAVVPLVHEELLDGSLDGRCQFCLCKRPPPRVDCRNMIIELTHDRRCNCRWQE
jgi:hypothetical protein